MTWELKIDEYKHGDSVITIGASIVTEDGTKVCSIPVHVTGWKANAQKLALAEDALKALKELLTTGAVFDPENDPNVSAAIRNAISILSKAPEGL